MDRNDSNYCPELPEVNDSNDFVDEHINDVVVPQNFLQDNLIDAPASVPKKRIAYALHSKQVDMKKLNANMWRCLPKDKNSGKIEKTMFSKVHEKLSKSLPPKMRQDVSCPLMFFSLLHLASEHNLKLSGQPDLKDFTIEQEDERTGSD